MDRVLKVYCTGKEQAALASAYRELERYKGFALLETSKRQAAQLAQRYPVEDITELYAIQAADRRIDTAQARVDTAGRVLKHPAYRDVKTLRPGRHHYLVQFIGPVKDAWMRAIRRTGGEPREHYQNFAYVVRARARQLPRIAALPFVRWLGHLPHRARLAPTLAVGLEGKGTTPELPRTRKLRSVYTVEFFGPDDRRAAATAVRALGFKILSREAKGNVLIVQASGAGAMTAKNLADLAEVHGVRMIRERSLKRPSNDVAAGIMGTASTLSRNGLGLSGRGEYIAVCDTGLDTGNPGRIHPDFAGRVAWIKSYSITTDFDPVVWNPGGDDGPADLDSGHGTHVAGSVLGSGAASAGLPGLANPVRGLAYQARLVFQAVEQEIEWRDPFDEVRYGRYLLAGIPHDLNTLFAEAYRNGARIHSNSWGGGDPGEYDEQCEQLDHFVWTRPSFCVVVAAGNDGTDRDGDGRINPMSVTSPGTAKNCITVGACENRRPSFNSETYGKWWPKDYPVAPFRNEAMADDSEQVVAFSSRGPTRDGRVKPDVVAPGTFVLSTRSTQIAPNNKAWAGFPPSALYFHMGGTSMATPLTAGAIALIRQHLRRSERMKNPSAALLKATLILGCERLPGYAPADAVLDIHQGFGRVNLDAVLAPTKPAKAVFRDVTVGLRTGDVHKFELDVKSNKVPLRVVLAYSDYPGAALVNNLNLIITGPNGRRYVGNQSAPDVMTLDSKNNVEVVEVRRPAAGTWTAEIIGSNVPHGPQGFALAYSAHHTP